PDAHLQEPLGGRQAHRGGRRRRSPRSPGSERSRRGRTRSGGARSRGAGARREEVMETKAILRGARMSAQKGRLVADLIRGKRVDQAMSILAYTPKKGAGVMKKLLESAIANAEHNDGADIDALTVKTIYVERGMFLKRFQARAKGRGNRVLKHTCHIFITVGD